MLLVCVLLIAVGAVIQQRLHGCTNWQNNWCT